MTNLASSHNALRQSAQDGKAKTPPTVAVLLCTMQGEAYLEEQLASIERQQHANWILHVSDDGSSDGTHGILARFGDRVGHDRVFIHAGPARGFAKNFLSITAAAGAADYYAYADQDDIWEEDKLTQALQWLQSVPQHIPALYCSRTALMDTDGNPAGHSPLYSRPPTFANALVQNIGGGNTMVFNEAARALLIKIGPETPVVSHDWWAYMAVTGCGGRVRYDPHPSVRYRQHDHNQIGAGGGWIAKLGRSRMLLNNRFKDWSDINITALQHLRDDLTPENRDILDLFTRARTRRLLPRLHLLKRAGIHRQTLAGNISLFAAALLNKL